MKILTLLLLAVSAMGEKKAANLPAPPTDEVLSYIINWPTGLSLGEARLKTVRQKTDSGEKWSTEFSVDASVPGFPVKEHSLSLADNDFCSAKLEKSYTHGKRTAEETTTFDQQAKTATRETKGGGKSEIAFHGCAKDALSYLDDLRRALSEGRLPPHQTVYFGAAYQVSVQFTGSQPVNVGDVRMEADRLIVTIKGDKTDVNAEIFFSKDAARKPVLVRVPTALAVFSMELSRPPE
jgi:hypothetical protein